MVGLYDYDTATKEECYEDLYETLENIDHWDADLDVLKRRAIRIQNIVERLQELGE